MKRKAEDAGHDVPRPKIDAAEMKRKLAEKAKKLKLQLAKVKAAKADVPTTHKPTINAKEEPPSKKVNPYLAHREDQNDQGLDADRESARARRLRRLLLSNLGHSRKKEKSSGRHWHEQSRI
jgi:hypothetical protein